MHCKTGHRANTCSMTLRRHGFMDLVNGTNESRVRQLLEQHA
ncbi:MAG: hypothetical protein WAQ25_01290 [Candidatus Saccharimonas sp.]